MQHMSTRGLLCIQTRLTVQACHALLVQMADVALPLLSLCSLSSHLCLCVNSHLSIVLLLTSCL